MRLLLSGYVGGTFLGMLSCEDIGLTQSPTLEVTVHFPILMLHFLRCTQQLLK